MSVFNQLFGAKKKPEAEVDAGVTQEKIREQVENIEMRIKKIENDSKALKAQALAKMKAGDKRSAGFLLRKSKMGEKELLKLEGQALTLE